MKRLYVAGPYSAETIDLFMNMNRGIRKSTEAALADLYPFCPWLDYQFLLQLREGESLSIEWFYAYSMAWLEVSDGILLLEGWEQSKGSRAEKKHAESLGIPVFFCSSRRSAALFVESYLRHFRDERRACQQRTDA